MSFAHKFITVLSILSVSVINCAKAEETDFSINLNDALAKTLASFDAVDSSSVPRTANVFQLAKASSKFAGQWRGSYQTTHNSCPSSIKKSFNHLITQRGQRITISDLSSGGAVSAGNVTGRDRFSTKRYLTLDAAALGYSAAVGLACAARVDIDYGLVKSKTARVSRTMFFACRAGSINPKQITAGSASCYISQKGKARR